MKYVLNEKKLKRRLAELGYANLSQFASKAGIHRNTLANLLSGRSVFSAAFQSLSETLHMDPFELAVPQSNFSAKIKHVDEIRPLVARLKREAPHAAIVLIGSRATGKAKPYSDWDLGVFGYPVPLSGLDYLR